MGHYDDYFKADRQRQRVRETRRVARFIYHMEMALHAYDNGGLDPTGPSFQAVMRAKEAMLWARSNRDADPGVVDKLVRLQWAEAAGETAEVGEIKASLGPEWDDLWK